MTGSSQGGTSLRWSAGTNLSRFRRCPLPPPHSEHSTPARPLLPPLALALPHRTDCRRLRGRFVPLQGVEIAAGAEYAELSDVYSCVSSFANIAIICTNDFSNMLTLKCFKA
eukprot:scaffold42775_cov38-Prasinocladus_malaysianus.AAC.1